MLTPTEWRELAVRQSQLAAKDKLTEEDLAELAHLNETINPLARHPLVMRFDELIELDLSEYPDWVPEYIRERGWEWAWFANHFGETLEEHVERCSAGSLDGSPPLSARAIEHINRTLPYPEGWVPESRR